LDVREAQTPAAELLTQDTVLFLDVLEDLELRRFTQPANTSSKNRSGATDILGDPTLESSRVRAMRTRDRPAQGVISPGGLTRSWPAHDGARAPNQDRNRNGDRRRVLVRARGRRPDELGEELVDALLGGPRALGLGELAFGAAAAIAIGFFIVLQGSRLILWLVSPDIANTAGVNVVRVNLTFLMMFTFTIALGSRS
jgi:hypothetical protein